MTCSDCEFFELSKGAIFVGDCLADEEFNHIETVSHTADFCKKFKLREIKENERRNSGNSEEEN